MEEEDVRRREGVGQVDDEEELEERSGGTIAVTGGALEADATTLMTWGL